MLCDDSCLVLLSGMYSTFPVEWMDTPHVHTARDMTLFRSWSRAYMNSAFLGEWLDTSHTARDMTPLPQLVKGMYSAFLGEWLDAFPREQLLILRNEDYKVALKEHMEAIFKFLGRHRFSFLHIGCIDVGRLYKGYIGLGSHLCLPTHRRYRRRKAIHGLYRPKNPPVPSSVRQEGAGLSKEASRRHEDMRT